MRKPTTHEQLYEWHRRALAGLKPPIFNDHPETGWFQTRLVRLGPWVPCRIWMEQPVEDGELVDDERLRAEIDGVEQDDPADVWWRVCGRPISEADWQYMEARRMWALYHKPDDPAANPRKRLDRLTTPIPF